MAQQTLDFIIAQQVTGQAEVAKLIKSVGALDAEMQRLRAATAGIEGGFGRASKAIRGNTNVLDAQSKALRNQRQGMQQAGMQVNDFVTSVSTGASPTQAFNQQIGQLGYAMSLMGGKASAVGRFLAGPWSIVVIGASMVLGKYVDQISETEEKLTDLEKTFDFSAMSASKLTEVNALLSDSIKDVGRSSLATKSHMLSMHLQNLDNARSALALAEAEQERVRAMTFGSSPTSSNYPDQLRGINRQDSQRIQELRKTIEGLGAEIGQSTAELYGMTVTMSEADKRVMVLQTRMAQLTQAAGELGFEAVKEEIRLTAIQLEAATNAAKSNSRATREVADAVDGLDAAMLLFNARAAVLIAQYRAGDIESKQFASSMNTLNAEIAMTEANFADPIKVAGMYLDRINMLAKAAREAKEDLADFIKAGAEPLRSDFGGALSEQISQIEPQVDALMKNSLDKIRGYTDEMKRSYEAIGNSVAEGFKGMITGAQSFGDAMKGVIQSVIDELFRLFVVQQIVGFVSKTLGSVTGVPLPARAMGGSVGQNKPYLVGERGPEIFVPGKSGTVIPTQNSRVGGGGGSTINVSVDARGATSPEMVRQQVQQGILEAAPSIVAAAEQRTITTLRRPRLAGAL